MGFRQCPKCMGYYPAARGGCINSGCEMADRAAIGRIATTPVHPQTKAPIVPTAAPAVALRSVKKPGVATIAPPKEPLDELSSVKLKSKTAVTPVAVAAEPGQEFQLTELQQLEAGQYIIYRGDSRTPAQLKGYGGFTAWVPLTVDQALKVIQRANGKSFKLELPPKAQRLQDVFNDPKNNNLNMNALGRQIKLEKAGDTFHISTDPTEACGGYASGYIYAMRFKALNIIDKGGARPFVASGCGRVNSLLMLDSASADAAQVVAVAIPGGGGVEVAFLTSIGMDKIYKYKEPMGKVWYKMP